MRYNIFQGNKQLQNVVAKSLGFEESPEHSWFTRDMFFETYFYLSKRFGQPKILDDYKDGGTWDFTVKNYKIRITLNSSWVSFIVFGEYRLRNELINSPYIVKRIRQERVNRHLLIPIMDEYSEDEKILVDPIFDKFCKIEGVDESWTQEKFDKEGKGMLWFDYCMDYNNKVLGVNYNEFNKKHGSEYSNSKTRHALKTLNQFINNMLTPINVRDCHFNIKGRITDDEAYFFERYTDNIKIEFNDGNIPSKTRK